MKNSLTRRPGRRMAVGFAAAVLATGAAAAATAPSASAATTVRKVLVIGIDGATYSTFSKTSLPNIQALRSGGGTWTGNTNASTSTKTLSGPGWSTINTGVYADKHNVQDNSFSGNRLAQWPSWLNRIESAKPSLVTNADVSWQPLKTYLFTSSGTNSQFSTSDATSTSRGVTAIRNGSDATFVHFDHVDKVGHADGSASSTYLAAERTADSQVGQLVAAVRSRPSNEQWLIIVTADHGHLAGGGHGGQSAIERTTFVITNGIGSASGSTVRIAASALKWVGVPVPSGLEGSPFD